MGGVRERETGGDGGGEREAPHPLFGPPAQRHWQLVVPKARQFQPRAQENIYWVGAAGHQLHLHSFICVDLLSTWFCCQDCRGHVYELVAVRKTEVASASESLGLHSSSGTGHWACCFSFGLRNLQAFVTRTCTHCECLSIAVLGACNLKSLNSTL